MKGSVHCRSAAGWIVAILFCSLLLRAHAQRREERSVEQEKGGHSAARTTQQDDPSPPLPAAWVWVGQNGVGQAGSSMGCFRKQVTLKAAPRHVAAWISADKRYRLYINGRLVSQGPTDPGEDYPGGKSQVQSGLYYSDYRDLTPYFHAGVNAIAVEVFAERFSSWYGSTGHPGLLFQAQITAADRSVSTLQADASWRSLAANYLRNGEGRRELYGRRGAGPLAAGRLRG